VTAACLAHMGHRVVGVDVNPAKVEMAESGRAPVLEPGLDQLVREGRELRTEGVGSRRSATQWKGRFS
jgi:UDP-glucose 6-dehydrogenase